MAKQVPRLVLYKMDVSPPSRAVMMLADLLGLKFEHKEPDLLNLEHKTPEFKKINPMGTIPILQDGDFIVSESHAIMKYLLNKYAGDQKEKYYPSEPQHQAIVDQCLYFDAGVLFPRLKVVVLPTILYGQAGPSPQHLRDIEEAYSVVEAYLQGNQYVAGDRLTIADLSISTSISATIPALELDNNKFPRTAEWLARLEEEKCFKEINAPGAALLTQLFLSCWEKNKNEN